MARRSPWLEPLVVEPGLEAGFLDFQASVLISSSSSSSSSFSSHRILCVYLQCPVDLSAYFFYYIGEVGIVSIMSILQMRKVRSTEDMLEG